MAAKVRKVEVVGTKKVTYTKKNTGEIITGAEVHFQYEDPEISGYGVGMIWVNLKEYPDGFRVGDTVRIYHDDFNRRFTLIDD